MKAAGEIGMCFLKARSSDAQGQVFYMKWDHKYLRISNAAGEPDDEGNVPTNPFKGGGPKGGKPPKYTTLLDVMNNS